MESLWCVQYCQKENCYVQCLYWSLNWISMAPIGSITDRSMAWCIHNTAVHWLVAYITACHWDKAIMEESSIHNEISLVNSIYTLWNGPTALWNGCSTMFPILNKMFRSHLISHFILYSSWGSVDPSLTHATRWFKATTPNTGLITDLWSIISRCSNRSHPPKRCYKVVPSQLQYLAWYWLVWRWCFC